jgi:pectin methylesterase-like acyl-CoA thioesterase
MKTPVCSLALTLLLVPGSRARDLIVAADGSGDFLTVQAAVEAAPSGSAARTTILVRRGVYAELVVVAPDKKHLTLRGEDRRTTIIAATNNAKLNPRRRELVSVEADDFILENLTLHNTTPKGGSQAEAIRVRADRVVLRDCDFRSFQDTLRLDGRVYVRDCLVEGDVDYVWGGGTVYFDRCTFHSVNNGYLVQSRNGSDRLGYVLVDCRLTAAPHVTRCVLARIEPGRFPHSHVAFVGCAMGPHVPPVGWQLDLVPGASTPGPAGQLRFEEFRSTDLTGKPLEVAARLPASRQLSESEAKALRNVAGVLGGWVPPER